MIQKVFFQKLKKKDFCFWISITHRVQSGLTERSWRTISPGWSRWPPSLIFLAGISLLPYRSCWECFIFIILLLNTSSTFRAIGIVRLKQPENLGPGNVTAPLPRLIKSTTATNFKSFYQGHEETRYIIMVLCPAKVFKTLCLWTSIKLSALHLKEKETKSATETSRTFATLFADINFR